MASKKADLGKYAEKQIKAYLTKLNNERAAFAFDRLPDARAARGALKAQVADFYAQDGAPENGGKAGLTFIEVKELEHPRLLPYSRITQMPVLRKWTAAGAEAIVALYHPTLMQWRLLFIDELFERKIDTRSSWILDDFELYDSFELACKARKVF